MTLFICLTIQHNHTSATNKQSQKLQEPQLFARALKKPDRKASAILSSWPQRWCRSREGTLWEATVTAGAHCCHPSAGPTLCPPASWAAPHHCRGSHQLHAGAAWQAHKLVPKWDASIVGSGSFTQPTTRSGPTFLKIKMFIWKAGWQIFPSTGSPPKYL